MTLKRSWEEDRREEEWGGKTLRLECLSDEALGAL